MTSRTQYMNNAIDTLDSSITNVATSLNVNDAILFPTKGNFYILIGNEAMLVTAVSGSTFTAIRGVQGTSAVAHESGSLVKGITNEGVLSEYHQENWVHGTIDTPKFTITDPTTGLLSVVTDFTWVNQGSATALDRDGKIVLTVPADAGEQFRGLFITPPSPPYSIIQAWSHLGVNGGIDTTSPFPQTELVFRESSTSKMMSIVFMPRGNALERPDRLQVRRMTNNTTFLTSAFWQTWQFGDGSIWCKIEDDNVDLKFHVGPNGKDWIEVFSESRTAHMAGGPNQVGFGANPSASSTYDIMMELLHFGKEI